MIWSEIPSSAMSFVLIQVSDYWGNCVVRAECWSQAAHMASTALPPLTGFTCSNPQAALEGAIHH